MIIIKDLLDPVAWCWFSLLLLGLCLVWWRKRGLGIAILSLMLAWCAAELFRVPARLLASLEAPYLGKDVESWEADTLAEEVDAVVMLGGLLTPSAEFSGAHYANSVDRLITAVTVALRTGKPLVLGGGVASQRVELREPDYEKRWLQAWGLDELVVEDLGSVRNTYDEIVNARAMASERGWKKVALVTSAWHMRRAAKVCERQDFPIAVVAADFQGTAEFRHGRSRLLPSAESAIFVRLWVSECVGGVYYSLREAVGSKL